MTKLTSYLIFLGFLLVPELNFGSDELLNGKDILHLLLLQSFLCKNAVITVCADKQSKPMKLVIFHSVGFGFSIKFLNF